MTTTHDFRPRVIKTAAVMAERYINPQVAARNRARGWTKRYVKTESTKQRTEFWLQVASALGFAYCRRSCPTHFETAVLRDIESARAAITKN